LVASLGDGLPRAQAADLAAAQAAAAEAAEALAQWQAAYGELQRQYEAAQAAYAELQARTLAVCLQRCALRQRRRSCPRAKPGRGRWVWSYTLLAVSRMYNEPVWQSYRKAS
jgi:hypothetical protein